MRSLALVGAILLGGAPAWAQDSQGDTSHAIVVTGTPLSETAKRLKACMERHCPPPEDVDASLAHAENQFIAGDYRGARRTLNAAHKRNIGYAREHPVALSDLDRAYGRLTGMNGHPEWGRLIQIGALETLKNGLDANDWQILAQRLMVGDTYLQNGRIDDAIAMYRKVERQARKQGATHVLGVAMLRPATIYAALGTSYPVYRDAARNELKRIERTTEPGLAAFRTAALVIRAGIEGDSGDEAGMDKTIAAIAGNGFTIPVLVHDKPPFAEVQPNAGAIRRNLDSDPEWIDVRYRIDASGHVQDIERLRSSPRISDDWPKYVLKSLGTRRYVPLKLAAGSNGLKRIERFTLVFDAENQTGSNMRSRSIKARLVSLDLTPDPPGDTAANKGR